MELTQWKEKLDVWFNDKEPEMFSLLERIVNMDSFSHDGGDVNKLGETLTAWMAEAGFRTARLPKQPSPPDERWMDGLGNTFCARSHAEEAGPGVAFIGHMDTVFPAGTAAARPFRLDRAADRATGPGAADMKAGLVQNMFVARALKELGLMPVPMTLTFTPDEELGSASSASILGEQLNGAHAVLCSEAGYPGNGVTIERINGQYQLYLTPYDTLENYAEQIQRGIDWKKKSNTTTTDQVTDSDKPQFDPAHAHDLWESADAADPQTMVKFTEKYLDDADKGGLPSHLSSAIAAIKSENPALPWDWYLRRMAGTLSCGTKHTTARLSRRQPYRLDLRGELHHYKARILVALDVSGSISDGEFRQAMEEVLHIVQTQRVEITVIECDDQIKKVYHVRSVRDLQERYPYRGGTAFSPVFAYANKHKIDLLIYFTDGQGEERLEVKPGGYKVFWILSGKGKTLSLHNPPGLIKPLKTKEDITLSELDDPHNDGYSMNNQEPIAFT